jgi:hypothetical protein
MTSSFNLFGSDLPQMFWYMLILLLEFCVVGWFENLVSCTVSGNKLYGWVEVLFIKSKTFELFVDSGGGPFIVRINERRRDSLRSILMGKESATVLVADLEDFVSKKHIGILFAQ